MKCPHCGGDINPASLLGKISAEKRQQTSEQMRAMALKRDYKKKTI